MTMSNEAYRENVIKYIPFTELFAEYRDQYKYGQELERKMNEAYRAGEIGQMYALAAELGVVSIQIQIIQHEVNRRDAEETPLSDEEAREIEAALFEELANSLINSLNQ